MSDGSPQRPARGARLPRPHRDDVLIAVCGLLSGLLLWSLGLSAQTGRPLGDGWTLAPLTAVAALEPLRRTRPLFALVAACAAVGADQFTPGNLVTVLMFTDIVYAAVLYGGAALARRVPIAAALATVGLTLGLLAWWRAPGALIVGVVCGLVTFVPAASGAIVRNHRDAADAARLRAEQTALLAEADRVQAVSAERARMARELHDMVAGHLSAIAIHSTAALTLDDDATTRQALTVIRENSVEGLADMRRLIGILRDSAGDVEPAAAPTLDGLPALVTGARANGLDVRLRDERPAGRSLVAPVELAAYRIVQESLTNALKHASPGPVTVTLALALDGTALAVEVTSPCRGGEGPRAPGSGAGLVGMRERVALLDGSFTAERVRGERGHAGAGRDDGTRWVVRATLPLGPAGTPSGGPLRGAGRPGGEAGGNRREGRERRERSGAA